MLTLKARMTVNDELGRIWKETIATYFMEGLLFLHLPGGTEENHKNSVKIAGPWM
jgi:hypothetical protein